MNLKLGKSARVLVTPACLIGVSPDPSGSSRSRQGHPGTLRLIQVPSGSSLSHQAHPGTLRLIQVPSGSSRHTQARPGHIRVIPAQSGTPRVEFAQEAPKKKCTHPSGSRGLPRVRPAPLGFPPKSRSEKKPGAILRGINWGSPGGKGSVRSRARDRQGLLSDLRVRKVPAAVLRSCKNAKKKIFSVGPGEQFFANTVWQGAVLANLSFFIVPSSSHLPRTASAQPDWAIGPANKVSFHFFNCLGSVFRHHLLAKGLNCKNLKMCKKLLGN